MCHSGDSGVSARGCASLEDAVCLSGQCRLGGAGESQETSPGSQTLPSFFLVSASAHTRCSEPGHVRCRLGGGC